MSVEVTVKIPPVSMIPVVIVGKDEHPHRTISLSIGSLLHYIQYTDNRLGYEVLLSDRFLGINHHTNVS